MTILYEYPKCTTCRKAKNFLKENDIPFEDIDLVKNPPSGEKISEMAKKSGKSLDEFFNSRGKKFKELDLKTRLDTLSDDEKLSLLEADGLLIKRPLLYHEETVLLGFKEPEYRGTFDIDD